MPASPKPRRNQMSRGALTAEDIRNVRMGIQRMKAAGWNKAARHSNVEQFGFAEANRLAQKGAYRIRQRVARKLYDRKVDEWNLSDRIERLATDLAFSDEAVEKIQRSVMRNVPEKYWPYFEETLRSMAVTMIMKSRTKEEAIKRFEKIEKLADEEEPYEEELADAPEPLVSVVNVETKNKETTPSSMKPKKVSFWERVFGPPEHRRKRH